VSAPGFRRPESVLVVVCTAGGEVLLLERVRPAGWWQSVTGSLDEGESPSQAAVRELVEETGLDAAGLEDLRLQARFPIHPDWRHRFAPEVSENLEHAFVLRLPGRRDIRLEEGAHVRFEWLSAERAVERATSGTDRQAIGHALGLKASAR